MKHVVLLYYDLKCDEHFTLVGDRWLKAEVSFGQGWLCPGLMVTQLRSILAENLKLIC
jgi:hypothetical protein